MLSYMIGEYINTCDIKGKQGWLLVGVTHESFETLLRLKRLIKLLVMICLYNFFLFQSIIFTKLTLNKKFHCFIFLELQETRLKANLWNFCHNVARWQFVYHEIERPHVKFCWFQQWHTISTKLKTDLFFTWCNWVILLSLIKYTFLDIAVILVIHHLYLTCLSF